MAKEHVYVLVSSSLTAYRGVVPPVATSIATFLDRPVGRVVSDCCPLARLCFTVRGIDMHRPTDDSQSGAH
jgi:hypothetical protein